MDNKEWDSDHLVCPVPLDGTEVDIDGLPAFIVGFIGPIVTTNSKYCIRKLVEKELHPRGWWAYYYDRILDDDDNIIIFETRDEAEKWLKENQFLLKKR